MAMRTYVPTLQSYNGDKKKKKYTCGEPSTEVDSHNRHTAMAGPWEMKGGRSGSKLCAL